MSGYVQAEVLLFTSKAEYESRQKYTAALQLAEGEVDCIVGKYELPADRAHWARCGLNNCNTEHRLGYVIRAKDARETNIGQDCGRRELGVSFEEVEATFKRREDEAARRRTIETLLAEKPALVERVQRASAEGGIQAYRLSAFIATFNHLRGLWREVITASKLGGLVRAPVKRDDKWSQMGGKQQLMTVARIKGSSVLINDESATPRLLDQIVQPWLDSLTALHLQPLSERELEKFVRDAANMRNLIARAETFVKSCTELLTADNIESLETICNEVLRPVDAGYARPYVKAWVASARSGAIPTEPVQVLRR